METQDTHKGILIIRQVGHCFNVFNMGMLQNIHKDWKSVQIGTYAYTLGTYKVCSCTYMYLHSTYIIFLWPPLFLLHWDINENNQHLLDRDCLRLCNAVLHFCFFHETLLWFRRNQLLIISMYINLMMKFWSIYTMYIPVYTVIYTVHPSIYLVYTVIYNVIPPYHVHNTVYTVHVNIFCVYYLFEYNSPSFFSIHKHYLAISAHVNRCQAINCANTLLSYNYCLISTSLFIHFKRRYNLKNSCC